MTVATAPGKIILFGEHAVVYHQPALAVPVFEVQARAEVQAGEPDSGLIIEAHDLGQRLALSEGQAHDALMMMAQLTLKKLGVAEPDAIIGLRSTIPIAGGMGSGAAVSAALGRALATYLGQPLDTAELSELVYEVEKLHHGSPSGIDNTVICYERPVFFVRGRQPEIFQVGKPFDLVIGDTGIASPTRLAVNTVREGWERDRSHYEALFAQIGEIVRKAREAIENGAIDRLGPLMNQNQELLRHLDVSSSELERLIETASQAGAIGAKLSGAGRGGNMIALVAAEQADSVVRALRQAGAARVIHTIVR